MERSGVFDRRTPRWGPSRTPRTATVDSLRFGPRRLYPHRGLRLVTGEDLRLKPSARCHYSQQQR